MVRALYPGEHRHLYVLETTANRLYGLVVNDLLNSFQTIVRDHPEYRIFPVSELDPGAKRGQRL